MALRPTIRLIAKKAGVNPGTVSRALRNDPRVLPKTREDIQKIAQQLGYRINPFVSAFLSDLKRSKTTDQKIVTIGYIATIDEGSARHQKSKDWWVNPEQNLRNPKALKAALERARQLNYKLDLFFWNQPDMTKQRLTQILYTRNIQGVIIAGLQPGDPWPIDESLFSCVLLGRSIGQPNIHRITTDTFSNTLLALRNLNQLGYQRIGLAMELDSDLLADLRYSSAYLGHHLSLNIKKVIPPFLRSPFYAEDFLEWYRKYSPDAIITIHPKILPYLQNSGIDVPGEVGVVNLNSSLLPTAMTAVDANFQLLGAIAVEILEAQLIRNERGLPLHPKLTLVQGKWVDGPTTRNILPE